MFAVAYRIGDKMILDLSRTSHKQCASVLPHSGYTVEVFRTICEAKEFAANV